MPPRFHATPPDAVSVTVRESVVVAGRTFVIDRPADPAAVFAHPRVKSAEKTDEYLPHWVKLWPAGRMLAAAVLQEPWPSHPVHGEDKSLRVLEVGCGLGLDGIAALARGLEVTFSDVDETALAFAANNARLNGFTRFHTLQLDLRSPPAGITFPVVIGSDVLYQDRLVRPLVHLLRAVLEPGGLCLIADPVRPDIRRFHWSLGEAGFTVDSDPIELPAAAAAPTKGTLDRIRFATAKPRR